MFRKVIVGLLPLALYSSVAHGKFLPDNDLHLEDTLLTRSIIEQAEFNEVIDEAEAYYAPLFSSAFGARLEINRLWTDSTVNANASQSGSTWTVNMYGGLARRDEVTRDGFALVLCHELGHHVGGYPFYSGSWAASEGQSDYFATLSCARELWRDDLETNASYSATVAAYPKALCDAAWTTVEDQNLCYRTMAAGKSLADLLAALGGTVAEFENPDLTIVSETSTSHPAGQCRLDTYMAGALCESQWDPAIIPGNLGANTTASEEQSVPYTCAQISGYDSYTQGIRPGCWFRSLLVEGEPIEYVSLSSGVAVENISGSAGSNTYYKVTVDGTSDLEISISGGSGDADLFVKHEGDPSQSNWDCRPYAYGNNETCSFAGASGTYYIMINGWSSYADLSLVATY